MCIIFMMIQSTLYSICYALTFWHLLFEVLQLLADRDRASEENFQSWADHSSPFTQVLGTQGRPWKNSSHSQPGSSGSWREVHLCTAQLHLHSSDDRTQQLFLESEDNTVNVAPYSKCPGLGGPFLHVSKRKCSRRKRQKGMTFQDLFGSHVVSFLPYCRARRFSRELHQTSYTCCEYSWKLTSAFILIFRNSSMWKVTHVHQYCCMKRT